MKKYLLLGALFLVGSIPMLAEIEDDIYYNPKQAAHKSNQTESKKNNRSNYIANFQDMNVDDYNMRGQYYVTPIDTIGARTENEQDFKYTTQIQKFYNPTIVVDNEDLLSDVLNNSYGNVTVEYNFNGVPTFGNWYTPGSWPYLWNNLYLGVGIYDPWYWGPSLTWSWGWGSSYWGWGPSWAWNSPWSWGWGPSWSWGWGPSYSWGWGPSYGWGWGSAYRPAYWADYRPGGNRPVGPNAGWSNGHRPNGNMASHGGYVPGGNAGLNGNHNSNYGYGRQPGQGALPTTRPGGNSSSDRYNIGGAASTNRGGYTIGADGHRRTGTTQSNGSSTGNYRTQNYNTGNYNTGTNSGRQNNSGAYNSNRSYNSGNSNRSYNSGNYNSGNSNRSSGSFNSGGHRSSGGAGSFGGGSRGSMGGGSRGGRR